MGSIYLDACTIIYVVEAAEPFHQRVLTALDDLGFNNESRLITSRLSLLECRVQAMRRNDFPLLEKYTDFFQADRLVIAEIDADIIERATQLRVKYAFRTPDAIHLATAIAQNAAAFLTGDTRLKQCTEIPVRLLG